MNRTRLVGRHHICLEDVRKDLRQESPVIFFQEAIRKTERATGRGWGADSPPCPSIEHVGAINNGSFARQSEQIESRRWVAHATTRRRSSTNHERQSRRTSALEENVQAIQRSERAILLARSNGEQLSDWIAGTAGSAQCPSCTSYGSESG